MPDSGAVGWFQLDDLGVRVVMDELLSAPSQADGKYCTLHCALAFKIKPDAVIYIQLQGEQNLLKFQTEANEKKVNLLQQKQYEDSRGSK